MALLELQDYDFLQGCKLGTQLSQKPTSAPNKEEELKVLPVETAFLRSSRPVFLALGLVQDRDPSDVRRPGCQMPDGPERKEGARRSDHHRCDGRGRGAQVRPGVIIGQPGLPRRGRRTGRPRLVETGMQSFSCPNLYNVSNFSSVVTATPFYIFPIFTLFLMDIAHIYHFLKNIYIF